MSKKEEEIHSNQSSERENTIFGSVAKLNL